MPEEEVELLEREGWLEARYLGAFALDRYLKQMEISVRAAEARGLDRLLVDITSLTGWSPTMLERHKIGVFGAELSRKLRKVAVMLPAEYVPDTHATTVARNRGLNIEAFKEREKAVEWLNAS